MPATLKEKEAQRTREIGQNEAIGVVEYKNGETQSNEVWQVTEGYKYLPGGKVLGPGHRFHPTVAQVEKTRRGRGGLTGKARELTGTEYDGLGRGARKVQVGGADFAAMERRARLAELPMSESSVLLAFEAGMDAGDFAGIEPEGTAGRYLKAQVEALIEARG